MSDLSWRKVERLLELEGLLRSKSRTIKELAWHFHHTEIEAQTLKAESAQRKLRYDLEFLMRDKFKRGIEKSDHPIPRYHIPTPSSFDPRQILALHSLICLFELHAPEQTELYHRIAVKMRKELPEHIQNLTRIMRKTQRPQQLSRSLEKINTAWVERRQIKFKYLKPGGSGTWRDNTVSVYYIAISRTNLDHYIIGHEHDFHNAIRTFKLSRLADAELLKTTYEIPPNFNPNSYLENAWGIIGNSDGQSIDVTLRFQASAIYRLDEGGYPNLSTLENHSDGSRTVKVSTGVNKEGIPLEVLAWVRSWGPQVEILGPQSLREIWLAEARAIVERYA
jgi:predicted DNA-binding transcriptional regulator YafY